MKKLVENFSEGVLNLFANIGVVIPYFFCLSLYNHNKSVAAYVLPFLMLYTFRSIGMLLTVYIRYSASLMLIISNLFGVIGSLCLIFAKNIWFGVIGGILLGLASSWIWPYFLTVRTKGKITNDFHLTKLHWLGSLVSMILLIVVELLAIKTSEYWISFVILALLFLFSMWGGFKVNRQIGFYRKHEFSTHQRNYSAIGMIFIVILVMLVFMIRYTRLKNIMRIEDLYIGFIAVFALTILWIYQLKIHQKLFPLSLASINRGIVMNFVLLYTIFDSSLRFGFSTLLVVYLLYLFGFEVGPFILRNHLNLRYPLVIIGLILSLFNFTYFIGILCCSLFVGSDNSILNNSLYHDPKIESERAFLVKYQLSAIGNISQQLFYMIIVYLVSFYSQTNALNFFSTSGNVSGKLLLIVRLPVTLIALLSTVVTYYFIEKKAGD
ncbi:hypothetical protein [Companilactobacillus baiquanensis]|uniref:MFS transporter n=1 Tax=Companilactobacillus baiquanensis TaxID=2486005 RepID=A0ABW1UTM5_9LACO|nr:hypothetical protein [Companilactobacillus baiquanensis]